MGLCGGAGISAGQIIHHLCGTAGCHGVSHWHGVCTSVSAEHATSGAAGANVA